MIWHWLLYLAAVAGCAVFYTAYQQWFSWFLFIAVVFLPVVSLVVSLPGMLLLRLRGTQSVTVSMGEDFAALFEEKCPLPAPPCRYRIRVTRATTGESWRLKKGELLPTDHCGKLICRPERAGVYDYLGLFRLRIQEKTPIVVVVRPMPVAVKRIPELERYTASAWRPKVGGGFSENHELRLYRPGDKLNQIHWKLSAKTRELIVREPMEPLNERIFVEMELWGESRELDQKFGKLLWMSNHLLELGFPHELRVLTGRGVQCLTVINRAELEQNLDVLLGEPRAPKDAALEHISASWRYRVEGGEADA